MTEVKHSWIGAVFAALRRSNSLPANLSNLFRSESMTWIPGTKKPLRSDFLCKLVGARGLFRASCPPPLRGRLRCAATFKFAPGEFVKPLSVRIDDVDSGHKKSHYVVTSFVNWSGREDYSGRRALHPFGAVFAALRRSNSLPANLSNLFSVRIDDVDSGHKKSHYVVTSFVNWSGREDSNLRPLQPHCSALPDCATPRHF